MSKDVLRMGWIGLTVVRTLMLFAVAYQRIHGSSSRKLAARMRQPRREQDDGVAVRLEDYADEACRRGLMSLLPWRHALSATRGELTTELIGAGSGGWVGRAGPFLAAVRLRRDLSGRIDRVLRILSGRHRQVESGLPGV
jgi:hypothetical protein